MDVCMYTCMHPQTALEHTGRFPFLKVLAITGNVCVMVFLIGAWNDILCVKAFHKITQLLTLPPPPIGILQD